MHVDSERDHRKHDQRDRPGARREHRQTGEGEHRAHGADRSGDADTGGEELEQQESETGQEQQVGDGWAGHGVEQLVDERELGEPHDCHGVEPCRAVVEHGEFGGDDHDTVLLVAVHCRHHVRDRRDAFVVDALLEHAEQPGIGQADRAVAEPFPGDAEVDFHAIGKARRVEWDPDVADPRSRSHAGDIGHGQHLRSGPVETGATRPDPDSDRDRGGRDAHEEVADHVVVDDGAITVDLEDQGL